MTGRQVLKDGERRRDRMGCVILPLAVASLVIGLSAAKGEPFQALGPRDRNAIVLGAFASVGVIAVLALCYGRPWTIRCPWCGASLSPLLGANAPASCVACCPSCRRSLDEEVPPAKGKGAADEIA